MRSSDPARSDVPRVPDRAEPPIVWGEAGRRISGERYRRAWDRTEDESRGSISTGRWMWEGAKAVALALVCIVVIRSLLVAAYKIPTGSMENTLMVGDYLLVNKAVFGPAIPLTHLHLPAFSQPRRGDVVVFVPPQDPTTNYVKRLVGVPGDTLEMRDKLLYVNGVPQREPYVRHIDPFSDPSDPSMRWQLAYRPADAGASESPPTRDNWGPVVVPPGKYFALGDNRDISEDSRYWGFVDAAAIRGRPMFVFYSFIPDPLHPFSWITRVRWGRIGQTID
ncbi:MAG TPA: signal peptidase I [Longimicrobiaceae bacterium]|nr:signal peptidase I [Longimicrobiaceae bacterium]